MSKPLAPLSWHRRLSEEVAALGLPGLAESWAATCSNSADAGRNTGWVSRLPAALTMLLTQDERKWDVAGSTDKWPNAAAWAVAKKSLLELLDDAFQGVSFH